MKSRREHKHSSVIYLHGTPVAFRYNTRDYHSEEEAMSNVLNIYAGNYSKYTIVNIRVTPGGRIGLAKPCLACQEMLREKKFRKVYYSTNRGTFEVLYL